MSFTEAIASGFRNYAIFSERSTRSAYWWWALFTLLVPLAFSIVGLSALGSLFLLAVLLPNVAVGVRRLHDLDRSGWWYLIGFIPFFGFIILIVWFIQRGTMGENRFGANPLGAPSAA